MAAEPGTDRSGIDGPTADGAGPPPEAHEFQIRPTRSAFPVLWDCLLPATAFLCYLPYATDLIAKLYLAFFGTFAVVPIVVAMFTRKGRRVRVDETGITVGRRRVLWEEVRDIRKWVLPITPITLVLKGRWRTMQLAACPEVLGGVLPAVLRIRPDLKVSKRVLRAMEFPEGTPRLRRWQTAGLLVMAMFLAFFPLMARQADALWALGALLALALCPFVSMLTPASTDDAKLALGTMFASLIVFFSFKIHLLCDVPTFVLDAVVATGAAMAFAAAVVHGFRWRLDFGRKAAIVACVLAVAAGFYGSGRHNALPREDISYAMGPGVNLSSWRWSADGRLAVQDMTSEEDGQQQAVLDLAAMRSTSLPVKGPSFAWGLNRSCVVRRAGKERSIVYVYRFADGKETELSRASPAWTGWGPCISPDGRFACWLEREQKAGSQPAASQPATSDADLEPTRLMVYDLDTSATRRLDLAWPGEEEVRAHMCGWVGDGRIAVVGFGKDKSEAKFSSSTPRSLHMQVIELPGGAVTHSAFPERFATWKVSPALAGAFAQGHGKSGDSGVQYVDFRTQKAVDLGGVELPRWLAGGRCAVRVRDFGQEGTWLCRFDSATMKEDRLMPIPAGMRLRDCSPSGRYAILAEEGLRIDPLFLVDTATGRRARLGVSMISSLVLSIVSESLPGASSWTPDERHFLMSSVKIDFEKPVSGRTWLYSIPNDW